MPSQTLGDRPDADALLAALGDRRRRATLHVLADSRESLTVTALAAELREARSEEAADGPAPSAARLSVSLHHVHLPTLDALGFVEYDRDDRRVSVTRLGRSGRDLVARVDAVSASLDRLAASHDEAPSPSSPRRSRTR